MSAAASLPESGTLRLLAPFEPTPLYTVLGQRGFGHRSQPLGDGGWKILFSRKTIAPTSDLPAGNVAESRSPATVDLVELDARGLEPPQPLVRILEAVAGLTDGVTLRAHTDRRPLHLHPLLEERGFTGDTRKSSDGGFVTDIRRSTA
jgi:uncharacterized protein (DUF2249 family)